jgi:VCBS repeat-containing protein
MSTQLGLISSLQGTVTATNSSGDTLTLAMDSPVFEGDQIIVNGQNAKAVITTTQNQKIVVTEESPTTLKQTVLEQVEQLQTEILSNENFDFSQLETPAAGPQEQTSFTSPIIIEPTDNIIEYHSATNVLSDTNQNYSDVSDTAITNHLSDENNLVDQSLSVIGQSFGNVTEDLQTVLQGQINSNTSTSFTATTQNTNFGEIHYDEQGNWQYALNNQLTNIQALGAGDTLTESISLTADNGGVFLVDITINGSNDLASISGTTTETVVAEPNNSADDNIVDVSGKLNITDIDAGEAGFVAQDQIRSTYGAAEINEDGEWRYVLNNDLSAIQSLTNESQLTDFFSVRSHDGANERIQITIQGTNDSPLLSGTNQALLNLDTSETVSGQLGINDPDFGESHFQAETNITGSFGIGSINENGHWTYQVDINHPDIGNLDSNTLLHDTFVIATADGTEQTIIIPITNFPATAAIASTHNDSSEALAIIELGDNAEGLPLNTNVESSDSSDLYIWNASNDEANTTVNTDNITQFTLGSNGDTLQLNDLLLESQSEDQLDQLLHFSYDGQDTTIEINTNQDTADQHFLVLSNIDITAVGNTDGEIINQLIQHGNLDIVGL